jgi:hypothetical protein
MASLFKRLAPLLAMTAMLRCATVCRAGEPSQEYKVKAAFIYNFARFIEWPAEVFGGGDAPFVIGVVGADPFNGALEQAVAGKRVGSRTVVVKHFATADDLGPCQILFVATGDEELQTRILQKVQNQHVLTVGESDTFDADGGCLRFVLENSKMRFEINTDATDQAKLKISSKLLKLAKIYQK